MRIDDAIRGEDVWTQPTPDSTAAGMADALAGNLVYLSCFLVALAVMKPSFLRSGWWWLLACSPMVVMLISGPISRILRIFL